ncbi:six-cysteine peptide SCIFF [Clostridia bacterium]|jgi:predicted ribosomally synthesized six-cysteine peptide SCIFF|nr:six-cysteine peptide SCIFF [Clostridia bacterium]
MQHIKTISKGTLKQTEGKGCGECQTSCQSACKTSCTIANQECEQTRIKRPR